MQKQRGQTLFLYIARTLGCEPRTPDRRSQQSVGAVGRLGNAERPRMGRQTDSFTLSTRIRDRLLPDSRVTEQWPMANSPLRSPGAPTTALSTVLIVMPWDTTATWVPRPCSINSVNAEITVSRYSTGSRPRKRAGERENSAQRCGGVQSTSLRAADDTVDVLVRQFLGQPTRVPVSGGIQRWIARQGRMALVRRSMPDQQQPCHRRLHVIQPLARSSNLRTLPWNASPVAIGALPASARAQVPSLIAAIL